MFAVLWTLRHLASQIPFISSCSGAAASSLIPKSLHAAIKFADVKADPALVRMKRTDVVWPSSSVCVSQDLRAVMIDTVLSVGSPIQPVNFSGVVTIKR
jgi:hypothetical protein